MAGVDDLCSLGESKIAVAFDAHIECGHLPSGESKKNATDHDYLLRVLRIDSMSSEVWIAFELIS